jgi:hypothetical protein
VADPVWFEGQLREAGIRLPDHVALVVVGGRSAKEIDICAAATVPGVAFPRQGPIEGPRAVMQAELIGRLVLVDGCLRIDSIHGAESLLPIWPPEFGLAAQGDEVQVLDGDGQVVARVGEEVYMGGGESSTPGLAECVREQLPATCTGPYWIVGEGVRPNLRCDSDLFTLEVVEAPARSFFLLHKAPLLDDWIEGRSQASGKLVLWETDRCPRLFSESGLGNYLPLWPPDYGATVEDGLSSGFGQITSPEAWHRVRFCPAASASGGLDAFPECSFRGGSCPLNHYGPRITALQRPIAVLLSVMAGPAMQGELRASLGLFPPSEIWLPSGGRVSLVRSLGPWLIL